jgi:pyruvate dehydrogenase E1 component alpha subunit
MGVSGATGQVDLLARFSAMARMRAFEEACAEGVRTGELRGELHLATGQESVAAGMLGALQPNDWMVGTHRSHPAALAKGVDAYRLLAEVYEKSTGLCGGKGGHLHLFSHEHRFSTTGIVGSSLPVALGHAYAAALDEAGYIGVGLTGDGGANTGQFFETLNMAAVWHLPLLVVVENNGYGISVPAGDVTASPGIGGRAAAFGITYSHADGRDVEEVAEVMAEGFAHVRGGAGPALVEVACSRFRGHYEGDPDHYRAAEVKESMRQQDPLEHTRRTLVARGTHTDEELATLESEVAHEMQEILRRVRSDPDPDPRQALTQVYAEAVA